ncbi:WavE lipopolysaccharide synthesis family protein [Klebsiella quasivariicola]|uniref:WavE lipopolysaccharide synthesis family protein n=1 Tax=Klebsiella quasivariicola TaxID=2026240 RepID=UPI00247A1C76|nr:WavE lipopolysaccharide synthesis family protein [Klebsiella quasivariicola]
MNRLSIIVQGSVMGPDGEPDMRVIRNLRRTRAAFPLAEIILSTWQAPLATVERLKHRLSGLAVRLVMSPDPGPLIGEDTAGKYVTNLNRMLLSSRAGLEEATRPLAVKLRTDCWLSRRRLLSLLETQVLAVPREVPRDPAYRVFRGRVVNASRFARDARGSLPYLFHPGDIFLAGYTEDLRLFFSAKPATAELFRPARMPGLWCPWRYVPEQWCWLSAIHKVTGSWVYDGNFEYSPANVMASEQWYLANFVPYSCFTLGLHWPKYWRCYPLRGLFSVYTHARWRRLAVRYLGGKMPLALRLTAVADRLLTALWRIGYRFRVYLLKRPAVRRMAMHLFLHRS